MRDNLSEDNLNSWCYFGALVALFRFVFLSFCVPLSRSLALCSSPLFPSVFPSLDFISRNWTNCTHHTRWATLMAHRLLSSHEPELKVVMQAFREGKPVSECVAALEGARS